MANGTSSSAVILGIALAAIVTVAMTSGSFTHWDSIIGITLIVILFSFGHEAHASRGMNFIFSSILSLSVVLAIGFLVETVYVLAGGLDADRASLWSVIQRILHKENLKPDEFPQFSRRNLIFLALWLMVFLISFIYYTVQRRKSLKARV